MKDKTFSIFTQVLPDRCSHSFLMIQIPRLYYFLFSIRNFFSFTCSVDCLKIHFLQFCLSEIIFCLTQCFYWIKIFGWKLWGFLFASFVLSFFSNLKLFYGFVISVSFLIIVSLYVKFLLFASFTIFKFL